MILHSRVYVDLHSYSCILRAILLWHSYAWTKTFNGLRQSLATCCLKKLSLSRSKWRLKARLV